MATLSNITVSGITTDVLEKRLDHLWTNEDKGLDDSEGIDKTVDGRTRTLEWDSDGRHPVDQISYNNYKVLLDLRAQIALLKTDIDQFHAFTKACLGTNSDNAWNWLRRFGGFLTSAAVDRNGTLDPKAAGVVYISEVNEQLINIAKNEIDGFQLTVFNNQAKNVVMTTKGNIILGGKTSSLTLGRNDSITLMWHKSNEKWYKLYNVDI